METNILWPALIVQSFITVIEVTNIVLIFYDTITLGHDGCSIVVDDTGLTATVALHTMLKNLI